MHIKASNILFKNRTKAQRLVTQGSDRDGYTLLIKFVFQATWKFETMKILPEY